VRAEDLVGWLGALIFVIRVCPQPVHIWRTGQRSGVAWLGTANAITSTVGWLVYGLAVGRPILWVPSLVALVPELVTLVLLGLRPPDRRSAVLFGLWATAVGVAFPLGGTTLLATVVAFGVVMGVGPHVFAALTHDRLDGVAARTWQIALLDAVLWGTYGFASEEPLTAFYGVVLGSGAGVILWRLRVTSRNSELVPVGPVGSNVHDLGVDGLTGRT
jgi:uncharacterized protein with PQ loop repeat